MEKIIKGATIFYGADLEEQQGRAIWIKDNKIHKVLKESEVPNGVSVENKTGKYLFPGLIDLHVHIMWDGSRDPVDTHEKESYEQKLIRSVSNCPKYLEAGITTIRDLGSIDDIALHVSEAIERRTMNGPRIIACGKTLTMTGGHDPFWGRFIDGPFEALKGVREQIYKGAKVIKVSATGGVYGRTKGEQVDHTELSYEELKVICDEAHKFGLKVASHAIGKDGIINSVKAGVDTIEHGHFINEEIIEYMLERDISWVPTLYIYHQIARLSGVPTYAQEKAKRIVEIHEETFSKFFNSGVLVGAGSDAGSVLTPHPTIVEELLTMKKFTNDLLSTIKTATTNAGKILGIPVGQIKENYIADFILIDKNPLEDIKALQNVIEVYLGGNLIKRNKELDSIN